MKLKNEIFMNGFVTALRALMNQPMPAKEAFQLLNFAKEIDANKATFDSARKMLTDRYAEKDEEGKVIINTEKNTVTIPDESQEAFNREHKELTDIEVEYSLTEKFKVSDNMKLSAQNLLALESVIEIV
jgi:hypothetical protein